MITLSPLHYRDDEADDYTLTANELSQEHLPEDLYCCGKAMSQIYNAQQQITRGWWCPYCNRFEAAILRERQLPLMEKHHG